MGDFLLSPAAAAPLSTMATSSALPHSHDPPPTRTLQEPMRSPFVVNAPPSQTELKEEQQPQPHLPPSQLPLGVALSMIMGQLLPRRRLEMSSSPPSQDRGLVPNVRVKREPNHPGDDEGEEEEEEGNAPPPAAKRPHVQQEGLVEEEVGDLAVAATEVHDGATKCPCGEKWPTFGPVGSSEGVRCFSCRLDEDKDIFVDRCVVCRSKFPYFAPRGCRRAQRCVDCRLDTDLDVEMLLPNRCEVCRKKASSFGPAGCQRAVRCKNCRLPSDCDIKCCLCRMCGARKTLCFSFPGSRRGMRCRDCRLSTDVDVINRKCEVCQTKQPNYGQPGTTRALRCGTCRIPGDINVVSKRCQECQLKIPAFGPEGTRRPVRCGDCRFNSDVNVSTKRCEVCHLKTPTYRPPCQRRALRCEDCRLETDVRVQRENFGRPKRSELEGVHPPRAAVVRSKPRNKPTTAHNRAVDVGDDVFEGAAVHAAVDHDSDGEFVP